MNKQTLDFEKPLVELEQKIEELKKQSEDRNIDLGREILGMQGKLAMMPPCQGGWHRSAASAAW